MLRRKPRRTARRCSALEPRLLSRPPRHHEEYLWEVSQMRPRARDPRGDEPILLPSMLQLLRITGMVGEGQVNPKGGAREMFHVGDIAGNPATTGWRTVEFDRRRFTSMLIFLGDSGGGGGAGLTAATLTAKGGGGGGGSGGSSTGVFPLALHQGELFYTVGGMASGGASSGSAGSGGNRSWVGYAPTGNVQDTLLTNGTQAGGGAAGAASGAAAAGSSGGAGSNSVVIAHGAITYMTGQIGATGGNAATPTAGSNVAWGNTGICFSGGGGGGASSSGNSPTAGGNITGAGAFIATLSGGAAVGGGPGGPGLNGYFLFAPFLLGLGGSGGGACSTAGVGGAGGNGGYSSGGGGGGGGVTGGAGGSSGPGFIYIACW